MKSKLLVALASGACTAGSSGIRAWPSNSMSRLPAPTRLRLPRSASTTSDAYVVTDFVTDSPRRFSPFQFPRSSVPPPPEAHGSRSRSECMEDGL